MKHNYRIKGKTFLLSFAIIGILFLSSINAVAWTNEPSGLYYDFEEGNLDDITYDFYYENELYCSHGVVPLQFLPEKNGDYVLDFHAKKPQEAYYRAIGIKFFSDAVNESRVWNYSFDFKYTSDQSNSHFHSTIVIPDGTYGANNYPNAYYLKIRVGTSLFELFKLTASGNNYRFYYDFNIPENNTWHHVDMQIDMINEEATVYVNNSLIATEPISKFETSSYDFEQHSLINSRFDTTDPYDRHCYMDNIKLYDDTFDTSIWDDDSGDTGGVNDKKTDDDDETRTEKVKTEITNNPFRAVAYSGFMIFIGAVAFYNSEDYGWRYRWETWLGKLGVLLMVSGAVVILTLVIG